jgi:hypothetical protein
MNELAPDLDHIHNGLISALRSIRRGGSLDERISIPPFGQSSTVGGMLALASQHLDEPFFEEQLDTARDALRAVGIENRSANKRMIALSLLQRLADRRHNGFSHHYV